MSIENEMWGINISIISVSTYIRTYERIHTCYLRWKLFHFLCMCKRTYDNYTLCATLLLAINYCHFLLRMASDIVIRLPGFRLVFLIWNECAKSLQDSKFPTKDKPIMNIILYEICNSFNNIYLKIPHMLYDVRMILHVAFIVIYVFLCIH